MLLFFINYWQCDVNMLRKLILSVRYRKEKEAFTKKIAIIVHNMETRKMILKSLGNLYHQSFVNRSKKEYDILYSSKIGKLQHGKVACVNGKQINTKARDGDWRYADSPNWQCKALYSTC